MNIRHARQIIIWLLSIGSLFLVCSITIVSEKWILLFTITGMAGCIFALLISLFFFKCPICDTSLPLSNLFFSEHCPYCGNKIYD